MVKVATATLIGLFLLRLYVLAFSTPSFYMEGKGVSVKISASSETQANALTRQIAGLP